MFLEKFLFLIIFLDYLFMYAFNYCNYYYTCTQIVIRYNKFCVDYWELNFLMIISYKTFDLLCKGFFLYKNYYCIKSFVHDN